MPRSKEIVTEEIRLLAEEGVKHWDEKRIHNMVFQTMAWVRAGLRQHVDLNIDQFAEFTDHPAFPAATAIVKLANDLCEDCEWLIIDEADAKFPVTKYLHRHKSLPGIINHDVSKHLNVIGLLLLQQMFVEFPTVKDTDYWSMKSREMCVRVFDVIFHYSVNILNWDLIPEGYDNLESLNTTHSLIDGDFNLDDFKMLAYLKIEVNEYLVKSLEKMIEEGIKGMVIAHFKRIP